MEIPYHKERILLGSISRRSLGNPTPSPKIPFRRVSDVDFSDVFGGPPRSSMTGSRHSPGGTLDPSAEKEESLQSFSNPWSVLRENPVFGEGRPRRAHLKQDFFDDIFKVDENLSSTPKQSDPFSSVPGSRIQSPVHPSLSRQLSLSANHATAPGNNSMKSSNGVLSPFGFPSSPRASRFASQMAKVLGNTRRDSRPSQRHSPLSDQLTHTSDESVKAIESFGQDMGSRCIKGDDSSDVSTDNSKFHFSIYKWASKGAPLTMQFRKGDRLNSSTMGNSKSIVDGLLKTTPEEVSMSSESEVLSTTGSRLHSQDDRSSQDLKQNDEPAPSKPVVETLYNLLYRDTEDPGEETKDQPAELRSPEQKEDNYDRAGNHEMQQQSRETSGALRSSKTISARNHENVKVKKQIGKNNISNQAEVTKTTTQDVSVNSEEKKLGNGTKGKVKEFVKIFNLDASTKSTHSNDRGSQNSRKTGTAAGEVDDETYKGNNSRTRTDPGVVRSDSRNPLQQSAAINFNIHKSVDPPMEKTNISTLPFGATSESFDDAVGKIVEIHSKDLETLDTKIQQWSTGREGNIRSLLSTLQYVLGSDSGWKPIPLVDIIEGACVKRAYQKALLCLHPDKLQQKGAGMQQKYIAEKVFDILQESWTHFNTLGSL
ncbi:J domain-containing protein required for chloroplast accumulation response 1 [Aristolochia californica]|uniref:J domain-containing protein required for chloroplast accumulation response 1 n=1 Tax=Aristolochia californica TaxID=171875 RepID=UPI0035D89858